MKINSIDIAIIGGGCAGMSAALSAQKNGADNIIVFERNPFLGGVLTQCIHNGFGIHKFHKDLTGTQYAQRLIDEINAANIKCLTETFVTYITKDRVITTINSNGRLKKYKAKAIILSTGCRERPRGALNIPGTRPAGIITAGAAQKYMNIEGYLIGKKIVILGSGDIGLIMARQFVLEGVDVVAVAEIMPYSSGLTRNIVQCLLDFDITIYYNTTVANILGNSRVEGVYLCEVDENRVPIESTKRYVECDTLVLSVGLIPEIELMYDAGVELSKSTGGAIVDNLCQTNIPGIFSCGNSLHVHDLADFVSIESEQTGKNAADYINSNLEKIAIPYVDVLSGDGICGAVPQKIRMTKDTDSVKVHFRPREKYYDKVICVYSGSKRIKQKKFSVLTPGEMCEIEFDKSKVIDDIKIAIEG